MSVLIFLRRFFSIGSDFKSLLFISGNFLQFFTFFSLLLFTDVHWTIRTNFSNLDQDNNVLKQSIFDHDAVTVETGIFFKLLFSFLLTLFFLPFQSSHYNFIIRPSMLSLVKHTLQTENRVFHGISFAGLFPIVYHYLSLN